MKKYIKYTIMAIFIFFIYTTINAKDLPKLHFTGDISNMNNKKDERSIEVKYESDNLNFTSYATIKIQGQHSTIYPKKNYNIKFYKDSENTQKNKIDFKWGKFYKYTLKANWHDSTHSRNIISADIAGDINKKYGLFKNTPNYGAIDGFPIEIYVNGKYHGLYTLNLNKEYMFEDGSDRDYTLISVQGLYVMRDVKKETLDWKNFEVEVGEENQETLDNLNRLLDFIHNSTDEEYKKNISQYINLDTLLNYYSYIVYADLWDNVGYNMYLLTYDGKIWYTVFYDLDMSYGGYISYSFAQSHKILNEYIASFPLWTKLERTYGEEIYERYNALRKDILTKNYVVNKFETYYNAIPSDAISRDRTNWPQTDQYTMGKLRNYLNTRTTINDKRIASLSKTYVEDNNSSNNSNNNTNTASKPTTKPSTSAKPTTPSNKVEEDKTNKPSQKEESKKEENKTEKPNNKEENKTEENKQEDSPTKEEQNDQEILEEEINKEEQNNQEIPEEEIKKEEQKPKDREKEQNKIIILITPIIIIITTLSIFIIKKKIKKN